MANSRMKDYYDLWVFAQRAEIRGLILVKAIRATFQQRKTPIPPDAPTGLEKGTFNFFPSYEDYRASIGSPPTQAARHVRRPRCPGKK